jgi:hypothetical protein
VIYNKTKKRNPWGIQQQRKRPEREWINIPMPELRIISDAEWKAAHHRLDTTRNTYLRGSKGELWGRPASTIDSKYLLKAGVSVRLNRKILHGKLLASRPSDNSQRNSNALFVGKCSGERERFPWSHRQITGEPPASTRDIPDCALTLKGTCMVRDRALHGEAAVGTDDKGHDGLAEAHCRRDANDGARAVGEKPRGSTTFLSVGPLLVLFILFASDNLPMRIPSPMVLRQHTQPFDDPNWIYEIKHDGFRALAVIERGHPFCNIWIASAF